MGIKIGEITKRGLPRWEVYEDDGEIVVEKDALNGSEDERYGSLSEFLESLAKHCQFVSTLGSKS